MIDVVHLRPFNVNSEKMWVTDPCYSRGTWCQGVLDNVLKGKWLASVEIVPDSLTGWGDRVGKLIVKHHSAVPKVSLKLDADIGVDSGQAGFFCDSKYPRGDVGDYGDTSTFYGLACTLTDSSNKAGSFPFGAVSRSGFGDGSYDCEYWVDADGKVVRAEIIFITDEELEDDQPSDSDFDL